MTDRAEEPPGAAPRPRRRSALTALAVVAIAGVVLWLVAPPARAPVNCAEDVAPGADTLVMLSASWCGYCRRARAFLQDAGIAHCEYDVETSARGRALFGAQPLKVIPVLLLRDDTLVGFNREEIRQTLAAHGLLDFE